MRPNVNSEASKVVVEAGNVSELQSKLTKLNITVPPRGLGRRSLHTERWISTRLIATLSFANLLAYPCILKKRERPDYSLQLDDREIGIEVSEIVHSDLAELSAIQNKINNNLPIDLSIFKPQKKICKKISSALLKGGHRSGEDWKGREPEKDWAEAAIKTIEEKLKCLNNIQFTLYSENWLALYHNYMFPFCDLSVASKYLEEQLDLCSGKYPKMFTQVYIECGDKIIAMMSNQILQIPNLYALKEL